MHQQNEKILFEPVTLNGLTFKNRIVMAPMTRSRAIGGVPNDLMAAYCGQRASAGLIITEGTSPSPNGLGYARIPGIFNEEQVRGWKKIIRTVHEKGSKIFLQLMHSGRISHPKNMPEGSRIIAPSAVPAAGEMWTDNKGMLPHPTPEAYVSLVRELNQLDILYIHIVELAAREQENWEKFSKSIQELFANTWMVNGGYTGEKAEAVLQNGRADMISFGAPFISNPDFPERIRCDIPLVPADLDTFYTPGEKGYTDYRSYPEIFRSELVTLILSIRYSFCQVGKHFFGKNGVTFCR